MRESILAGKLSNLLKVIKIHSTKKSERLKKNYDKHTLFSFLHSITFKAIAYEAFFDLKIAKTASVLIKKKFNYSFV